ncbi:MAG: hypothetical protein EAX86_02815 [Candidatus Heimdallarchaeota archaeon]|nr:hypothetical protein [Candidatus Heimdallarchaeota archaeon]
MSLNTPIYAILHAYQPANQNLKILDRIVNLCYLPIAKLLEQNADFRITLNFNASLSELLEFEYPQVIEKYIELARHKQIEFLDSGAYHPILPLLSPKEVELQIKLNNEINSRIFGPIWNPIGFWPPELAVSTETAALVEQIGYKYMIIPEISISTSNPPNPLYDTLLVHSSAPNLALINRNREVSNNISFKGYSTIRDFTSRVQFFQKQQPKGNLIIASDLETFGEHHLEYYKFLIEILSICEPHMCSELLNLPVKNIKNFRSSSWSTSEEDLYRNIPFPLWAYPGNSIHQLLNFHSDLLSESLRYLLEKKDETDYDVKIALKAAAKAQYSCQQWWASIKDHFSKNLIIKGIQEQRKALELILNALGNEGNYSLIIGVSDRTLHRLEGYLSRIR